MQSKGGGGTARSKPSKPSRKIASTKSPTGIKPSSRKIALTKSPTGIKPCKIDLVKSPPHSIKQSRRQKISDRKRSESGCMQALVNIATEELWKLVRAEDPVKNAPSLCSTKVSPEDVSAYIKPEWVAEFVKKLPIVCKGSTDCKVFEEVLQNEMGKLFASHRIGDNARGLNPKVTCKLAHIRNALTALSKAPCQDPRAAPGRMIVSFDIFADEVDGDIANIMRCGRGFTVNDPLAFNLVLRAMQSDASYTRKGHPRGTKGMTDVMKLVGLGPPVTAVGHIAASFRGPKSTDPDKKHPDGDRFDKKRETDGLYYRRYEYTTKRVLGAARSIKMFQH